MRNTKRLKKLNHVTLAEGEVTGHSHRAKGGVLYADEDDSMVLERKPGTVIEHEEHAHFALPATPPEFSDLFDVRKVVEIDHATESARKVTD